jgi:hypothetical protein
MKTIPCRVHIILAREAPVGIAIRGGSSKRVCTVGWARKTDTFRVGQWLKGRKYERRSDLSPDSRHLIYFAMNGKWQSKTKGSWTAMSRAPFLKAIGLWANGSCWNGGGLFTSDHTYWLNAFMFGHEELLSPRGLKRDDHFPFRDSYGGECPGVYYVRLQCDGWRLGGHERVGHEGKSVFEKPMPKGWVLQKTAHATIDHPVGRGCYFDTHRLRKENGSATLDLPDWEWADLDGRRVLWIAVGVLHAAHMNSQGLTEDTVLFDFNPIAFEELRAPY